MLRPLQKAKSNAPQTMTVMQVAAALQISRSKAYEIVRGNDFPKIRIGKRILVPRDAFHAWMEKNTMLTYGDND